MLKGANFYLSPNNPSHAFTEIVRSSLSCSLLGTFEKKSSPVAFSTASTVTAKVANGSSLPSLGRMNPIIFCRPLLLLPPIPPSIRVFSNESTLRMRWPKYWSFSFSTSPSKEHPGLISFRMDWLDLLAVQGTLKRLLQHLSSKTSILWCSAFFHSFD